MATPHDHTCCDGPHGELQRLAQELADEALDPTLASCCQRDLEEQAAAARLRARLTAVDRSNVRKQVAQGVLRSAPPPAAPGHGSQGPMEDEELGGSDEEGALARFRALRVEEMQRERAQRDRLQSAGHGALTTIPAARLLDIATSSSSNLVCHIAAEGSEACDALDEHLSTLAYQYLGTRFVRAVAPHGSLPLLHSLGLAGPGLACFREGALVGAADLGQFLGEEGELVEEAAGAWLRGRHVLRQPGATVTAGTGAGGREPTAGSSDEEEGEESWQPACEVCGRRYPHQHIRSAFTGRAADEDTSDDGEEG